jgi:hypothetical protein
MKTSDDGTILPDDDRLLTGATADSSEPRERWQRRRGSALDAPLLRQHQNDAPRRSAANGSDAEDKS